MVHPLPWLRSVEPSALVALTVVPRGAHAAGSVADALVIHDRVEQARRQACGLGAVTSLALLDSLMNLPAGEPVRVRDLSEDTWHQVLGAPIGAVEVDGGWVTRMLTPPLTVVAVLVRETAWRPALRRAGRFHPFAQRLVLVDQVPSPKLTWEAQVAGIGVWADLGGQPHEVCRPEPYVRRYWKAAGWRFAENAYKAATTSTFLPDWSTGVPDRPVRTAS